MYILQHHVHIHAAITMRFAPTRCRTQRRNRPWNDPNRTRRTQKVPIIAGCSDFTRKNARFPASASSPKPAPCNIHAAITMRFASTRCRTQRRNRLTSKWSKPHPPHTGGALHRRLQPLYTEKRTVSCPGFLPKTNPVQHSCSHHNAFCRLNRMCLRTWQQSMTTIMQPLRECIVMWCQVSHHSLTPPFVERIVMWCQVSHHSLTLLHWVYSYVM